MRKRYYEHHGQPTQGLFKDEFKDYVNELDQQAPTTTLPTVPQFPVSQVTETATEAFEVWKRQVQMPDLDLASDLESSDDSLDEFVAQEMPRVGKATL